MQRVNEEEREFRFGDCGPKYIFRGPNIDWGILVLKPGQSLKPHYHNQVEETFYFLCGSPKIIVERQEFRVRPGDAFLIEPKEKHDLINDTQENTRAVIIKYPSISLDKVDLKI